VSPVGERTLVGRWRIVQSDRWERDELDAIAPAMMVVREDGWGGIAFGTMHADLEVQYGEGTIFFTWAGFDELAQAAGFGCAELLDDGTLEIDFTFDHGREAVLKAERVSARPTA
jgi:hypothetical protein